MAQSDSGVGRSDRGDGNGGVPELDLVAGADERWELLDGLADGDPERSFLLGDLLVQCASMERVLRRDRVVNDPRLRDEGRVPADGPAAPQLGQVGVGDLDCEGRAPNDDALDGGKASGLRFAPEAVAVEAQRTVGGPREPGDVGLDELEQGELAGRTLVALAKRAIVGPLVAAATAQGPSRFGAWLA